jgi:predicted SnoaL-like aldol condensation-catalyzing enzyme
MTEAHESNKRVVREFLDLALNRRQPEEAVARYVAERCRMHDPRVRDGDEPLIALVHGITTAYPALRYELKRQIAEGDLVVTHGQFLRNRFDRGLAAMSIFRIENERIVEHWGCFEDVPEEQVVGSIST